MSARARVCVCVCVVAVLSLHLHLFVSVLTVYGCHLFPSLSETNDLTKRIKHPMHTHEQTNDRSLSLSLLVCVDDGDGG